MNMLTMTAFLLMAFCILKNAAAQDLQTTCPAKGFSEGEQSQVNCSVNRSFFDTNCPSSPTVVSFAFVPTGGSSIPWCSTDYQNCMTTGTPNPNCKGCNCGCIDDTTNIFIYSLTFVPDSSHNDGSFTCEISCFSQNPTQNFSSCKMFPVAKDTPLLTDEQAAGLGVGLVLAFFGSTCSAILVIRFRYKNTIVLYSTVDITEEDLKSLKKTGARIHLRRPANDETEICRKKLRDSGVPDPDKMVLKVAIEISWLSKDREDESKKVQELIKVSRGQCYCRNDDHNMVVKRSIA